MKRGDHSDRTDPAPRWLFVVLGSILAIGAAAVAYGLSH